MERLPELQNGLDENIEKVLRGSYDRLHRKYQELFLYIALLFNGHSVQFINDILVDVNIGLKTLADKSLIRITPDEIIQMHNLLEKLGTEIDRAESKGNPGERRFLKDAEEILDVFTDKTVSFSQLLLMHDFILIYRYTFMIILQGTKHLLGICFNVSSLSQIKKPFISIDENSFEDMLNLQYLGIHDHAWWQKSETRLHTPNGLVYLPRKLKWLEWNNCPLKCLPYNFKAEYLVCTHNGEQ